MRPFIFVLAGVNGAGKSSVGGAMLAQQGLDWFNPDSFARELTRSLPLGPAEANARAWEHGRAALEAAIKARTNYAFETTLGGTTMPHLLGKASKTHSVVMLYCGLASPEMHIARVAQRVAHGGHAIAEEKIRERWTRSRVNLIKLLPLLARLQVFDNSAEAAPGHDIPDPTLVLDVEDGRVLFPDVSSAAAMHAVPLWARGVVEAALDRTPGSRRTRRT